MQSTKLWVILVLAVVAGFAGGALSSYMFKAEPVIVKEEKKSVIEAEDFRVVDKEGRFRGGWGVNPHGSIVLVIADKSGVPRAGLSASEEGAAGLFLFDKDNTPRAKVKVNREGFPSIELNDENGKTRAVLGHADLETITTGSVEKGVASSLVLFNKEGKVVWSTP